MQVKCKKCGNIIQGDKKGTLIYCNCKSVAVDETPYYYRIIGNSEDFEEINDYKDYEKFRRID